MSQIMFDTQVAFLVPDDKRDEYFELVDKVADFCPNAMNLNNVRQSWDTTLDPIVIVDMSYFSKQNGEAIRTEMMKLGAKDITDSLSQG